LRHDCPPQLAPGATCTAHVALSSADTGRRSASLQWLGDADGLPQWTRVNASVETVAAGALVAAVANIADPTKYSSQWPSIEGYGAGRRPGSATVVITKNDGGMIGFG